MHMNTPQPPRTLIPAPENSRDLRAAFGKFATGITLITCDSADGAIAIVANSFSSVSLDPALVLWCLDHGSSRFPYFDAADHYAIHVLHSGQSDLCQAAAKDKFALQNSDFLTNEFGVPVIEDCLARFECRRVAKHAAGDHDIIVGQVTKALWQDGAPLAFFEGRIGSLT